MKKIAYVLFIVSTITVYSQNKSFEKDCIYSCQYLENFRATDSSLYDKLPSGKMIFAAYKVKAKLFKVTIKDEEFYYVSEKKLVKKVKRSIRKNKCIHLKIRKVKSAKKLKSQKQH